MNFINIEVGCYGGYVTAKGAPNDLDRKFCVLNKNSQIIYLLFYKKILPEDRIY